ncbi:MAG: hypothetical protein LBH77_00805 [Tannerella sp.]|nr:hypothetical protein [Tannerella sp.]
MKYFLIITISLLVNLEAFCCDTKISSDEPAVITCANEHVSAAGQTDLVDNTPAFLFYDMLLAKEDSYPSKAGIFVYFSGNCDRGKHILSGRKYRPDNPAGHYIYPPDYYLYTLEKIVI